MTVEERLDHLAGIVDTLAVSVVAHNIRLENLIKSVEEHDRPLQELSRIAAEPSRDREGAVVPPSATITPYARK